jgi:hypothetical protein
LHINSCRCLHRDRWDEKVDHQFSANHKMYARYSHGHHRGQNGDNFARPEFNASREINPVDDINGVLNYTAIISRTMFNEFRIGYMRRAASNPARPDLAKAGIEIPGVTPETFPFLNIGYGIAGMGFTRQVGEDRVIQNNFTLLRGKHSFKMGYEFIRTLYSDKATSLPSGQYNFGGGTSLPFTPNTGIEFASFLMGTVTSATFTKQFAIFMPRQWVHEWYLQDDWKILPAVTLNLGLRWSYSSPFRTKWDQQSQFDPDATDPLTGLKGAITHPRGRIGNRDLNNYQPRIGLAWSFHKKWVFRASYGIMTSDSPGPGGFDEYQGSFNVLQPVGDPRHLFRLQDGPGPVRFDLRADGTVPYTGANYGQRTATWRDRNLRSPYMMNWSGGFQFQPGGTWLVTATYQASAGVGLQRNWNINQIPNSIALSGDRALQDRVFQAQQNYLLYPQFGAINLLSNFNHNTWHSGNVTVEKRYGNGLILYGSFNFSKNLSNDDTLTYYTRAGKARTAWDQQKSFGAYVIYELPAGKGKRWLNRGRLTDAVFGGWKLNLSQNMISGIPLSVSYAGSPNRYLLGTSRATAVAKVEDAKVDDWQMGQRFPIGAQNPYFNMNAFAYPAAYTLGSLGARVLQAPGIVWMQCFATKTWTIMEKFRLSARLDGHNLPLKRPNLAAPNTTYNLNNVGAWARFSGVLGDFSNYGTGQANVQMSIRVEF